MKYYANACEHISSMSRYKLLRVIDSQGVYHLETFNNVSIPESPSDNYHVVEEGEVNRLDIIAYKYYNDASYWWMIALANNLIDPMVINRGTMLRIPNLSTVCHSANRIINK